MNDLLKTFDQFSSGNITDAIISLADICDTGIGNAQPTEKKKRSHKQRKQKGQERKLKAEQIKQEAQKVSKPFSKAIKRSIKSFKEAAASGEKPDLLKMAQPLIDASNLPPDPKVIELIRKYQQTIDNYKNDISSLDSLKGSMVNLGMNPLCFDLLKCCTVLAQNKGWETDVPESELQEYLLHCYHEPETSEELRYQIILDELRSSDTKKWVEMFGVIAKMSGSDTKLINQMIRISFELPKPE